MFLFFSKLHIVLLFEFRYTGFCPQLKFTIGKTFGHATEKALQDEDINPYLTNTEKTLLRRKYPTFEERLHDNNDQILERRRHSPGNIFQENMISGYTGVYKACFSPYSIFFFVHVM